MAGGDPDGPLLAFQRTPIYVAPRWPDPAFPQQIYLDLKFDDRASVQDLAERLGAVPLPPQGGSCPVYADPAGHPFCWDCRRNWAVPKGSGQGLPADDVDQFSPGAAF